MAQRLRDEYPAGMLCDSRGIKSTPGLQNPLWALCNCEIILIDLGTAHHLLLAIHCNELVLNPCKLEFVKMRDSSGRKIIGESSQSIVVHGNWNVPRSRENANLTLELDEKLYGSDIKSARYLGSERNGVGRTGAPPINLSS